MNRNDILSTALKSLIFGFAMICVSTVNAEGTREAAPNGSIVINGNTTTDIAALHLDHPSYNRFASYSNPDPNNRLRISIVNPGEECIYIGFSAGHLNQTTPTPPQVTFEYRVKDPAGNVIYGPITVTPQDANIADWTEAFAGPNQIAGVGGYNAMLISSADLMSQGWNVAGDYYIEFREASGQPLLIDFWDITVANCSGAFPEEKKGRVWSFNWAIFAINDFGFPVRPFNGSFYVCAPDPDNADAAFVTQIDFNGAGFRPAAFNVAFNSFGSMNTGNIVQDRRSVENINATQPEYAIFLNDPIEFCETAISGDVNLLGVTRCNLDAYCVKFTSSKEGQVILLLDFDGFDGIYTPGTADLLITTSVEESEVGSPTCIDWDGLDGLGNPIAEVPGTQIPVIISYAQGIYHFPIFDAEFMDNGFTINAIRPTGDTPLLFYDDSGISVASGSGEPAVQLQGCTVPCHRWSFFEDPNVPGFGNLNTINSWWFSQLIIREEVFVIPSYFECGIDGPSSTCDGDTTTLSWMGAVAPDGADAPTLISTEWSGPGIVGGSTGTTIEVTTSGTYTVDAKWLTSLGDTCGASCTYDLIVNPNSTGSLDTLIGYGDTLYINGEEFTETGEYTQVLISANGCDSILIITLSVPTVVIHYDLDACEAKADEGTNTDYSDFPADYPDTLDCALISAGIVHRVDPTVNPHSCTAGVGLSRAMCVSSNDACDYNPGNNKSVIFEVTVNPTGGNAVSISGLTFFEKAPDTYDWIDGNTGPNNYPTLYGIRVLKNGTEIFRMEDIPTTGTWTEQRYDFLDNDAFTVDAQSTFKFELLGYCLIGNGANVAAWDLDEISVQAACASIPPNEGLISGTVFSMDGTMMEGVLIELASDPTFSATDNTSTGADGGYLFEYAEFEMNQYLRAYYNEDTRLGLSTLDILFLQKHILGLQPFEKAYQFIAGDVNNDQQLSAGDIIDIKKLLLGLTDEFPRNDSWRFGDASAVHDMTNPWSFGSIIEIENYHEDYYDAHFEGIKIGDVSGSINLLLGEPAIKTRNNNTVSLQVADRFVKAGESVMLTVHVRGEEGERSARAMMGMQFALKANGLEIETIHGGMMEIDKADYNSHGDVSLLSWSRAGGLEVDNGAELFVIEVRATRNGMISEMIDIDDVLMASEVYMGDELNVESLDIAFVPGVQDVRDLQDATFMRVAPNPFTEKTTIHLVVPEDGEVVMRFYDISGRMLFVKKEMMVAGVQVLEVSKEDLGVDSGVVVCRVSCRGVVAVKRLLVLGN